MKNDHLLAVDIGNTDTVLGIFSGSTLAAEWRAPSASLRNARRAAQTIRLLLAEAGVPRATVDGAVVSSVVPALTRVLAGAARAVLGQAPYVVSGAGQSAIRLGYAAPATLGADRLCSAVAARARYGAPVIVVDIGTAITYDVVLRSGVFAGGAIAPGFAAAASGLTHATAALPPIPLEFPPAALGRDTVSCMQSGVMFGTIDAIEGMIRRIRRITGPGTTVVATGGGAGLAARHSRLLRRVEPFLVLEGARLLYKARRR
jgi:type III pantothenate kinase